MFPLFICLYVCIYIDVRTFSYETFASIFICPYAFVFICVGTFCRDMTCSHLSYVCMYVFSYVWVHLAAKCALQFVGARIFVVLVCFPSCHAFVPSIVVPLFRIFCFDLC